jgi:ferrochelatase
MSCSAVIAMAYGTPETLAELEPYYTHIRHGRPPTPELLAELCERYEAIGGRSPLLEITGAQAAGLRRALHAAGHDDVEVVLGMKHAPPFIEDTARDLVLAGVEHVVGLVLAPHYSSMSVGAYAERLAAGLGDGPGTPSFAMVRSWATAPGYIGWLAQAVRAALAQLGPAASSAEVVFTAHSLPEIILSAGDPYPDELGAGASPGRAPAEQRTPGSDPTSSRSSRTSPPPVRAASSSARPASSPTISRSSTTSTSRPPTPLASWVFRSPAPSRRTPTRGWQQRSRTSSRRWW